MAPLRRSGRNAGKAKEIEPAEITEPPSIAPPPRGRSRSYASSHPTTLIVRLSVPPRRLENLLHHGSLADEFVVPATDDDFDGSDGTSATSDPSTSGEAMDVDMDTRHEVVSTNHQHPRSFTMVPIDDNTSEVPPFINCEYTRSFIMVAIDDNTSEAPPFIDCEYTEDVLVIRMAEDDRLHLIHDFTNDRFIKQEIQEPVAKAVMNKITFQLPSHAGKDRGQRPARQKPSVQSIIRQARPRRSIPRRRLPLRPVFRRAIPRRSDPHRTGPARSAPRREIPRPRVPHRRPRVRSVLRRATAHPPAPKRTPHVGSVLHQSTAHPIVPHRTPRIRSVLRPATANPPAPRRTLRVRSALPTDTSRQREPNQATSRGERKVVAPLSSYAVLPQAHSRKAPYSLKDRVLRHPINRANATVDEIAVTQQQAIDIETRYGNPVLDAYYMRDMATALFTLVGTGDVLPSELKKKCRALLLIGAGGTVWLIRSGDHARMVAILVSMILQSISVPSSVSFSDRLSRGLYGFNLASSISI